MQSNVKQSPGTQSKAKQCKALQSKAKESKESPRSAPHKHVFPNWGRAEFILYIYIYIYIYIYVYLHDSGYEDGQRTFARVYGHSAKTSENYRG